MYVSHIVQTAPGRITAGIAATAQGRQHPPRCSRGLSQRSSVGPSHDGVIYMQPPPEASQASDALSCQPASRTAVTPWLRQLAVLVRSNSSTNSLQQQQPRMCAVSARCSNQESAPSSSAPTGAMPAATGVMLAAADPNSLALRDPSHVSQRPQPGPLGFRPSSSSSTTLASMLPQGPKDLAGPKAAAGAPVVLAADASDSAAVAAAGAAADAAAGTSKGFGPLSFLQWANFSNASGSSSMYWGSPIGGTLYINPCLGDTAVQDSSAMHLPAEPAATAGTTATTASAAASAAGNSSGSMASDVQNTSRSIKKLTFLPQWDSSSGCWGSPIGGTLYINPSVHDVAPPPPQNNMAVLLPPNPTAAGGAGSAAVAAAATAAATAAAATAAAATSNGSSRRTLRPPRGAKTSKLPMLPPFKWGNSNPSTPQWGSPMGGTLYINPQAPADWHNGWGSGGSGAGRGSGGSSSSSGGSSSRGGASAGSSSGGSSSKPGVGAGSSFAHARAGGQVNWGAVPLGMGIAKLGVVLMAACAAAAAAVLLMRPAPSSNNGSSGRSTLTQTAHSAAAVSPSATAAAAAAAGKKGVSFEGPQPGAVEGVGFHEFMVQRLQSTLEGFEAEQAMLRTEQAVLKSMGSGDAAGAGVFGGLRRWLGSNKGSDTAATPATNDATDKGSSSSRTPAGQGAAATSGANAAGAQAAAGNDVAARAARLADIRDQLESLDVLKAALSAELAEQQQLLQKAQHEAQAVQGQLAALAGR